jgi:hypothetical protein
MRHFARSISRGRVLLVVGLATLGLAANKPDSPAPEGVSSPDSGAEDTSSSREFQGVWYRTPEKKGVMAPWLAKGKLIIGAETISFESDKLTLTIAGSSVKRVLSARLPNDPGNIWIVVEFDEGGSGKAAAFKGAGLGRDTKAIQTALLSFSRAAAFARGESSAPREKAAIDFDGRSWKQGYQKDVGTQAIIEYVLPGETVDGWTELVSVVTYPGAQQTSLAAIAGNFRDKLLKECPDALWRILNESQDQVLHEFETKGCHGWDDQHEIAKLMKGTSAIFRVSYASRRLPFGDDQRSRWVALVGAARLEAEVAPAVPKAIAGGAPPNADVGTQEEQAEFAPYEGFKEQFTIALPVGWQAHDQNAQMGKPGPYGVVIFSPINLASVKVTDVQKQLADSMRALESIDSGETPSLLVDRHKSQRGISCSGIEDKARKRMLDVYETSAMGTSGHLLGTSEVKAMPVGGCQGLRVMLRSRDPDGTETHTLVYAVSDGETAYDFFLRNRKEFFEKNLPIFEKAVSTLKIASRGGQ